MAVSRIAPNRFSPQSQSSPSNHLHSSLINHWMEDLHRIPDGFSGKLVFLLQRSINWHTRLSREKNSPTAFAPCHSLSREIWWRKKRETGKDSHCGKKANALRSSCGYGNHKRTNLFPPQGLRPRLLHPSLLCLRRSRVGSSPAESAPQRCASPD